MIFCYICILLYFQYIWLHCLLEYKYLRLYKNHGQNFVEKSLKAEGVLRLWIKLHC